MNKHLEEAITVFNQGGIVIFPTDTAFGIGCRVDKPESIERLFTIRKRPVTQPMSLLVNSKEMASEYVKNIPQEVFEKLINPFWPGALTIIFFAKKENVPALVRGNGETIGVRMPKDTELLDIITAIGVPILGPSANFHGEKTPFNMDDVHPELVKLADYMLLGQCEGNTVSTVIDCTKTPWQIVRQGAIRL